MPRPFLLTLLASVLLAACTGTSGNRPSGEASPGSPEIEAAAIQRHAESFADVPERAPGSQEEFAAATYITGHLQQAGYTARLDAVPVANLVRSTNVLALPPSGEDPIFVVIVDYGASPLAGMREEGLAVGAFLEVARALAARVGDHSVEFVALGAQDAGDDGALGSKRLARFLLDAGSEADIVQILGVEAEGGLIAGGPGASEICPQCDLGDAVVELVPDRQNDADPTLPLVDAGFRVSMIGGDPVQVAETLVEFLEEQAL